MKMDKQALNKTFEKFEKLNLTRGVRHKIIVGIDYGTTFSGISYVTTDKNDIDDINIISSWPGELRTAWKTPTRIAYKQENKTLGCNKWGFEVDPKLISYSWTKLLLDKNAAQGDYDDPALSKMSGVGMMRLPPFRDAPGVCQDFLQEMYTYVSAKLKQQMSATTYDMTPMECWITLPAIWSEEAKDATLQAAKKAGFGSRPQDEIYTIAEPEAAAIATLKKFSGSDAMNSVKPNEHILICDCGGGTVDVTTYTITEVTPRLDFDELCIGVGGKCGSTYIDRNLHALMSRRFGTAFENVPHSQKGPGSKFMTCFEKLKQDFGHNDDRGVRELSPINLNISDSQYYDDEERMVKLTYRDMQSLFDPVVSEITNLVDQQVKEAKTKKGAKIDRIILVGGFGESAYLNQKLGQWCLENGKITLICPEHPQAAVVRGAALRGLEGLAPRMKQARRHYGFSWGLPFREGKDAEKNAYIESFTDTKYCGGRINWVIAKGEAVFKDDYRSINCVHPYTPGQALTCRIPLFSSPLNDPQENEDEPRVEKVGSIVSTFPANYDFGKGSESSFNTRLGKKVYQFSFQLQVIFGSKGENLTYRTLVNGNVSSTSVIEFPRN
ncbi:hypothetical protein B7494_g6250 [Chlorociboria aeruginascens]|nr:hypothetical protein B7494_g6250 [Chlorociboria aeruginascens]